MRLILILTMFACLPSLVNGQTFSYFNKTYGSDTLVLILSTVIEKNNKFYCGVGYTGLDTVSIKSVMAFDSLGNKTNEIIVDSTDQIITTFINQSSILTKDKDIVYCYSATHINQLENDNIRIAKIKDDQLIWQKEYGLDDRRENVRRIYEANEGGYLVVGNSFMDGERNKFYVLKTDEDGEEQWSKTYAWNNFEAYAVSAVPTEDGGFLIGGGLYNLGNTINPGLIVMKIDSLGNKKKVVKISARCQANIVKLPNGGYLLDSCKEIDGVNNTYFIKLDEDLNIIWEKLVSPFYDSGSLNILPYVKEDGSFVSCIGFYNEQDGIENMLIEFDSLANVNWMKPVTVDPAEICFLLNMFPTADGGYVWSGTQWTGERKGWLLKTDCQGNTCATIGCDSTYIHTNENEPPLCLPPFTCNPIIKEFDIIVDSVQILTAYNLPTFTDSIYQNYRYFYISQKNDSLELLETGNLIFNVPDTLTFSGIAVYKYDVQLLDSLILEAQNIQQLKILLEENKICTAFTQNNFTLIVQDLDNGLNIQPQLVDFFELSPNPATERVILKYRFNTYAPVANWLLYDLNGNTVKRSILPLDMPFWDVPIYDLQSGIYVYVVKINGQIAVKGKLVVE